MSFIPTSKIVSSTPSGSNTTPGLTFSNDNDTGLYDISNGVLGVTTNGILAASFNASQQLDMANHKIINLLDPTLNQEAATKIYVDNVAAGLDVKAAVRVATTANLSVTAAGSGVGKTLTATANGAISIDGVSLSLNDRVLVKNQSTAVDNGIYTVTTVGDATHPYVLTRAVDFDGSPSNEVSGGDFCFVEQGTQSSTGWTVINNGAIVVDTNPINWTQFNASGGITYPLTAPDGSTTAPSYSFTSSTNSGLYYNSAGGSLALVQSGAIILETGTSNQRLTIQPGATPTASFLIAGDLGIAQVASPLTFVVASSNIKFGTSNQLTLTAANPGATGRSVNLPDPGTTSADVVLTTSNQSITGTKTFTGASQQNLYVLSSDVSGVDIRLLASGSTEAWIQTQSNHPLKFTTNNAAAAITIDTSQRVGIGTPSPSQLLHVVGAAASTNYYVELDATSTSGQGGFYTTANVGGSQAGINILQFGSGINPSTAAGISQVSMARIRTDSSVSSLMIDASGSTPVYLATNDTVRTQWGVGLTSDINNYFTANTNGQQQFTWTNSGTGYGSFTAVNTPLGHALQMGVTGSGATGNYVTNGPAAADIAYIQAAGNVSGLTLNTNVAAPISFATNNTLRLQLTQTALIFSADCVPNADITNDNGNSTHRWLNIWGQQIHAGDVVLDNGWAITEGDKVGRDKDEVLLKSPSGKLFKFVLEAIN